MYIKNVFIYLADVDIIGLVAPFLSNHARFPYICINVGFFFKRMKIALNSSGLFFGLL